MRPFTSLIVLFLGLGMFALSAAGDTPTAPSQSEGVVASELLLFEDIPSVYAASKYSQDVEHAPSAVSIVTAEEIRTYGYRTLGDALAGLGGVFTTYDRNYTYLGMRGLGRPGDYNTRVLLLVDGLPTNENIYGAAAIGNELCLDINMIDRIELIRGPSSSLYGTSAFFGVINVITKDVTDFDSPQLSLERASLGTTKGTLTYGKALPNGVDLLLSSSYFDSDGHDELYYSEFDDDNVTGGIARKLDQEQYKRALAKISYKTFALQAAWGERDKSIPTAPWGVVFADSRSRTYDSQFFIDLKHEHQSSGGLNLLARLTYLGYTFDGGYPYDYSEDEEPYIVVNKDEDVGRWWEGEAHLIKNVWAKHRFTAGAQFRASARAQQKNYDEEVYLNSRHRPGYWGIFLQDEFVATDRFRLSLGGRYDQYETFGGTFNPRFAVVYQPALKTTCKIMYGTAFRAPSNYELYYHDGYYSTKPANKLDPETIETAELVLSQKLSQSARASINVYTYRVKDLIDYGEDADDELFVFENISEVDGRGIEMELQGRVLGLGSGRVSYALQEAKDATTGEILSNSPKYMAKCHFSMPILQDKLQVAAQLGYLGPRKTVQGGEVDAATITTLNFTTYNVSQGLDLSLAVYNVFDVEYYDPSSTEHTQEAIAQDGRTIRLRVDYNLGL
ncbi:TonB-dependent receptor plug domain-containing protein [Candidatus Eisenbacteria bacterium]|uniref:TonB-dependent receptor plug domain-containing protein n=1 Tax=Eiseniibacteriota bacterium TaxID=2212470 RepID=A0ABV6YJK6_UNCEI